MTDIDRIARERLEADPAIQDLMRALNDDFAARMPRNARYRYWETTDGRQFHYTTEPLGDGKYASAIYLPAGKGARSGKAEKLVVRREVHHRTRRGAKARAYGLYVSHRDLLAAK